jgi:hypothetical protein
MSKMRAFFLCSAASLLAAMISNFASAQPVVTHHNDILRTGWNPAEKTLTTANVGGSGFNLLATTTLDGQVDSQPLIVPNQTIGVKGEHTVVYVATANNILCAIDGLTGQVPTSRNFGTPVPQSSLPSRGSSATIWRLNTPSSSAASLTQEHATSIPNTRTNGFFTSISSNGTQAGSAIIWALTRPASAPGDISLIAIDPGTGNIIYSAVAGNWTSSNSNSNTIPTISGGRVYVATDKELTLK